MDDATPGFEGRVKIEADGRLLPAASIQGYELLCSCSELQSICSVSVSVSCLALRWLGHGEFALESQPSILRDNVPASFLILKHVPSCWQIVSVHTQVTLLHGCLDVKFLCWSDYSFVILGALWLLCSKVWYVAVSLWSGRVTIRPTWNFYADLIAVLSSWEHCGAFAAQYGMWQFLCNCGALGSTYMWSPREILVLISLLFGHIGGIVAPFAAQYAVVSL